MAPLTLDLWAFVKEAGVPGVLVLILVASMQGRFVWRREYDRDIANERREKDELRQERAAMRQERDAWRQEYLRASGAADGLRAALIEASKAGN